MGTKRRHRKRALMGMLVTGGLFGSLMGAGCTPASSPARPGGDIAVSTDGAVNGGGGALSSEELALARRIAEKKCKVCHDIEGEKKGLMSSPGFLTTAKTLPSRMADDAYHQKIEAFQERKPDYYAKTKPKIDAILAESDLEKRQALWIRTYLENPRFDDEKNRMNYVPIQEEEIDVIVKYMLSLE